MARTCDRCNATMAAGRPRVRVGGRQLWCQTCVKDKDSPSGRYRPGTDIDVTASVEDDYNAQQAKYDTVPGTTNFHLLDTNHAYRAGHTDGARGDRQEHDRLRAKVDMKMPLDDYETDYLVGHTHGTQRARQAAENQSRAKDIWETHGQPYGGPSVPGPRTGSYHDEDDFDEDKCPSCGVPGNPEDSGEHYTQCKRDEPTLEDREDKIYNSLHPHDYCNDTCRDSHATDLARGIGSHHIFSPGEAEHDDKRNLPSMVAPNSQNPHEQSGYRHGGDYEYRNPSNDARCHYCRNRLVDPGMNSLGTRKVAHDSGDGQTIYHCPFCGSGQVIARSDGTIDCEFCHTMFTVQVQPEYPAFPQTINGMPVQVPGMPGQIDSPVGAQPPPMDPSQVGPDGQPMDAGAPPVDGDGDGAVDADQDGEEDPAGGPPWAKKSLLTATGARLSPEEYLNHLAIKHAPDPEAVIAQVRARRNV